jgi:hypothetical protein
LSESHRFEFAMAAVAGTGRLNASRWRVSAEAHSSINTGQGIGLDDDASSQERTPWPMEIAVNASAVGSYFVPTARSRSRRAQGLSKLAASSRPPEGLGLDWPEHGGKLARIGLVQAPHYTEIQTGGFQTNSHRW